MNPRIALVPIKRLGVLRVALVPVGRLACVCGVVGSGVGRRGGGGRPGADAVEAFRLDLDGQTGCGTPPCRQSDSAVDSSASARRARACPSVEAGLWFAPPGPPEPVSSNAGPHRTEPSFAQCLLTPQTEPSRRLRLPKFGARKTAAKRVLWACRPALQLHARASRGSREPSETHKRPATSAASARAGNKAQWAKRRRAHARKSCPWPRNKQRPWPPINWTSPPTRRSCPRRRTPRPRRRY